MFTNHWRQPDALRTALRDLNSQLWLLPMGTGILAVNLQTLPYQFDGLGIISIILWILAVIEWFALVLLFILRGIIYPTTTFKTFDESVEQAMYISVAGVASSTLVDMVALVLGRTWDGWGIAAMVMWYCDMTFSVLIALVPLWIIFRRDQVTMANLPPSAILPATAILSSAAAGAIVITYSDISVRAAQPVMVISYCLLGMGFFTLLAVLANYTGRLMESKTPPPEKAFGSFIPIGAISNAAYTTVSLGRIAGPGSNLLVEYGQGYVADTTVGLAFYGFGVVGALLLVGFATYWFLLSIFTVSIDARKAPFTLNYWSAMYPWGVYAAAFGQLAMDFDSPAFRVLNTIMSCSLTILWLYSMARTVPMMVTGEVFLADAEDTGGRTESFGEVRRLRSARDSEEEHEA